MIIFSAADIAWAMEEAFEYRQWLESVYRCDFRFSEGWSQYKRDAVELGMRAANSLAIQYPDYLD